MNGKFVQGVRFRTPFLFVYSLFINDLRFWHGFGILNSGLIYDKIVNDKIWTEKFPKRCVRKNAIKR